MMWFGKSCGAPYESDTPHAATPVGLTCGRCDEDIAEGDDGFVLPVFFGEEMDHHAYHYECHMRGIVGGLNHLIGKCTCCGGDDPPDPPELTKREAAKAAVTAWLKRKL